ncbi:MAG: TonB-dependent receptor [Bacteroides sp.]|nr:TonB-dependent receptor [Bacteroides sp.]
MVGFGFLENKLNGSFEVYRRNTNGMLGPVRDFPAVAGATEPKQNAADMKTNGWELGINWRDRIGKVNYGVGFNIYDSRSEITRYENENKAFASEDDKTFYVGK